VAKALQEFTEKYKLLNEVKPCHKYKTEFCYG